MNLPKKKKNHEVAYVTSHIFRTWSHGHTNCLGNMEFSNKIITCPAKLTETIAKMKKRRNGILQARILEWVAYPFSRGSS